MNFPSSKYEQPYGVIARLLGFGTLIAVGLVSAGMVMAILFHIGHSLQIAQLGYSLVKFGVATFIFLPIVRVVVVLMLFLKARDYLFVAITGLVLAIISLGMNLGLSPI